MLDTDMGFFPAERAIPIPVPREQSPNIWERFQALRQAAREREDSLRQVEILNASQAAESLEQHILERVKKRRYVSPAGEIFQAVKVERDTTSFLYGRLPTTSLEMEGATQRNVDNCHTEVTSESIEIHDTLEGILEVRRIEKTTIGSRIKNIGPFLSCEHEGTRTDSEVLNADEITLIDEMLVASTSLSDELADAA